MIYFKKAIGPVVAMTLLLFVAVTAGVVVQNWMGNFQDNWNSKVQANSRVNLEIMGIKYLDNNATVLGLRNNGGYHVIDKILMNGEEVNLLVGNVVEGLSLIYLNYTTVKKNIYSVDVITNKGTFSKSFTVFDAGINIFEEENIYVTYANSNVCEVWETKLFGMYFINNSHVEISSQLNYQYDVCIDHPTYIIGNSCSGNSVRLFYLAGVTNSPIYIDNSTAASEPFDDYYNWQEVCLSLSSGSADVVYSELKPDFGYDCIVSYVEDDYNGGVVGTCDMYSKKIWLKLE